MKKLIVLLFVLSNVAWSPSELSVNPYLTQQADYVHAILDQLTISDAPYLEIDNYMKSLQEGLRERETNFFCAAGQALKSDVQHVNQQILKNILNYNHFFTSDQRQKLHEVLESIHSICGKVIFYKHGIPQSEQQAEYKVLSNAILGLRTFNKDHDLEAINELANTLVQIQDICIMFDRNGINNWKSQAQ